jgi:restriction endonuclease S subunit
MKETEKKSNKIFLINRSDVTERIDPLYFKTINSLSIVKETSFEVKKLSEVINMQRGRFGHRPRNDPKFYNGKYPFIQTGDVVRASITGKSIKFSQTLNELGLKTSRLFESEVMIITIAANIGDTAILDYPACFPDSLIAISPKDSNVLNLHYLNVYFKFLKNYLNDLAPQSAQKNINYQQLAPVPIVIPPFKIQKEIVELYKKAYLLKRQKELEAKELLKSIDNYLLNVLGLILPIKENNIENRIFTVNFSEIVGSRFDPDYISKYEFLINQKANFDFVSLGSLTIKSPQYGANEEASNPTSESDVRYIRITDIDEFGFLKKDKWKTANTINEIYKLNQNDILFARSGSVGRCYIHKEIEQKAIFAGYLIRFVFDETKVLPDFIFNFCNSSIYKFWVSAIERPAVQSNINSEEFKSLPIPLPNLAKQKEIVNYITGIREQIKSLQTEAKQVLEDAKQEVEKMILG